MNALAAVIHHAHHHVAKLVRVDVELIANQIVALYVVEVVVIRVMYYAQTIVIIHVEDNVMGAMAHAITHALQHVKLYAYSIVVL